MGIDGSPGSGFALTADHAYLKGAELSQTDQRLGKAVPSATSSQTPKIG